MDSTRTQKRHRSHSSNSRTASHRKSKVKKSSQHRDSSSPSSAKKEKSLAKYHGDSSRKEKRKKRKRKVSTSSSSSASSSSSESSSSSSSSSSFSSTESSEHLKHKSHHKKTKFKKGKKKKLKKKHKNHIKKCTSKVKCQEVSSRTEESNPGPTLDLWRKQSLEDSGPVLTDEQKTRAQAMKPMTKEEWDARQSVIRKVMDPETGRMRLIKGDGEVLEEIVSKDRHKEINKQATANDGFSFQMKSGMF